MSSFVIVHTDTIHYALKVAFWIIIMIIVLNAVAFLIIIMIIDHQHSAIPTVPTVNTLNQRIEYSQSEYQLNMNMNIIILLSVFCENLGLFVFLGKHELKLYLKRQQ